ncbi:hypothetical protein EJ07DRAFT_159321 [Lizonia empirigonia]|nr:hypothetical protein EJ07DRAFT_159321 [Lizonia empirigonia]
MNRSRQQSNGSMLKVFEIVEEPWAARSEIAQAIHLKRDAELAHEIKVAPASEGKSEGRPARRVSGTELCPRPIASPTDFDRFKAASSGLRAERTPEVPKMVARPSTSGGPGERAIQFHKKTLPAPSVYSEDRFLAFSSPTSSTAVLHAVESPQEVIGIALGSPTIGSHWTSTPQATTENLIADSHMSAWNHANASMTTVTGPQAQPKPKISRWKSLFKKTAPPPREKASFYQLAQQVTMARADSHHDTSPKSRTKPTLKTAGGVALPVSVFNSDMVAIRTKSHENLSSQEVQHGRKRSATLDAGRAAPRYRFQRSATTPNPPQAGPGASDTGSLPVPPLQSTQSAAGAGLLGVNIPDVSMDRYSVMFSGVLESTPNRSSLYQRRQEKADTDKAKPLGKIIIKNAGQQGELTRTQTPTMGYIALRVESSVSATVVVPCYWSHYTYLTSRYPNTTYRNTSDTSAIASCLQLPRARSKTAPERTPTHQTFKTAEQGRSKPPSTSVTRLYSESPGLKPQQPALTPTSIRSFESDNESITIVVGRTAPAEAKAWKAHVESQEPEWEILPKPTSMATSSSTNRSTSRERPQRNATLERSLSRKQPRVTAASALCSHPSSAPIDVSSPLQNLQLLLTPPEPAEPVSQTAAEWPVIKRTTSQRKPKVMGNGGAQTATVGIARSVSVGKATRPRTLMRPHTDSSKSAERLESPEKRLGVGMGERLALTPTLVEIGNRKSQRVQLVDA